MSQIPSREILWNLSSSANVVCMYLLFALSMLVATVGILRHYEFWRAGRTEELAKIPWLTRFEKLFTWGLLQKGVSREPRPGLMHALIYIGFLVLLFTTTMVFIHHDLGIKIYQGGFYLGVTLASDILGFGVLIGCGLAAHRRYVHKLDRLHNRKADSWTLFILALLIVQGFLLEGLRIKVTEDPWRYYSPVGAIVSAFFWGMPDKAASNLHFLVWWFHTITVFAVIALLPYSKFFHIISSSVNLYFRDWGRPKGALKNPGDLAQLIESGEDFSLGLGHIKDYSWKELMDLDACTSCGRCQDVCPAYITGKPLSPKWLILDTRNHALALHSQRRVTSSRLPSVFVLLDSWIFKMLSLPSLGLSRTETGAYKYNNGFRAANPEVKESAQLLGNNPEARISGEVMDPDVFWSCTTCMACVQACPVGINHVDQIVGNRRNMALMHGELPQEAQNSLRGLENRGNPFGPAEDRVKWFQDLGVRVLQPGDSVDYLYWVGCVSAYDQRKQNIARALVKLMQAAGLSFGVLGSAESCTGDPARRLGEENLFQTLAKTNIETLKKVSFKTLVANCPHCFNTIKNEYPQFGNLGDGRSPEIIHHSVLLRRLLKQGKLQIEGTSREGDQFTFHDPCYLGRYNDEYDAPRESLKAVKGLRILEMDRSRENGLCCGAGGGHFWMDLKIGKRVNVERVEEAQSSGANKIATACPFCMHMLEDGLKLTNSDGQYEVKDIAEVLAANYESSSA